MVMDEEFGRWVFFICYFYFLVSCFLFVLCSVYSFVVFVLFIFL